MAKDNPDSTGRSGVSGRWRSRFTRTLAAASRIGRSWWRCWPNRSSAACSTPTPSRCSRARSGSPTCRCATSWCRGCRWCACIAMIRSRASWRRWSSPATRASRCWRRSRRRGGHPAGEGSAAAVRRGDAGQVRHARIHAAGGIRARIQAAERAAARNFAATATTWRSWSMNTAGSRAW